VTLHVHTHVREDALLLYAFATAEDRMAFRTLLGVSSVGPKLALAVLSSLSAPELAAAIASGDRTRFKGISGVGKRTAERLLLELKDKLGFVSLAASAATVTSLASPKPVGPRAQVVDLLVGMGFKAGEAERAVTKLPEGERAVEELLREALQQLA
jgi:Holliday junction DNA helicase RuvA